MFFRLPSLPSINPSFHIAAINEEAKIRAAEKEPKKEDSEVVEVTMEDINLSGQ